MSDASAVEVLRAERERYPLDSEIAVTWGECLLRLGVPQRFLLKCWPGTRAFMVCHCDPIALRALVAASERVWRSVKLGVAVEVIIAREEAPFSCFKLRTSGQSSLAEPWLQWRSREAQRQWHYHNVIADVLTPVEYSDAHLEFLRGCAELVRAEVERLREEGPLALAPAERRA